MLSTYPSSLLTTIAFAYISTRSINAAIERGAACNTSSSTRQSSEVRRATPARERRSRLSCRVEHQPEHAVVDRGAACNTSPRKAQPTGAQSATPARARGIRPRCRVYHQPEQGAGSTCANCLQCVAATHAHDGPPALQRMRMKVDRGAAYITCRSTRQSTEVRRAAPARARRNRARYDVQHMPEHGVAGACGMRTRIADVRGKKGIEKVYSKIGVRSAQD
jgi:hypothetical protein